MASMSREWQDSVATFEQSATHCQRELQLIAQRLSRPGIVAASPEALFENRIVQSNKANISTGDITSLGFLVGECCEQFGKVTDKVLSKASSVNAAQAESIKESIRNYRRYLDDFSQSIHGLIVPRGVSVTHASQSPSGAKIRSDTIGLAEPLTRLLWSHVPTAFLSATLAVDGSFDFFTNTVGSKTSFDEVLDAPFDHSTQAALYLPPKGSIPDPSEARKNQSEPEYYRAIADQVIRIIAACSGRTLVLFHSRKEMEAVAALVPSTSERPILMQLTQGVAEAGEQFKKSVNSSLFALRSFWTGFDAPGETLSCVVLVRIPFEVPIDPPQIARAAHLQTLGLNPFAYYTLPMAKIMMRQGAGRLIRGPEDRGVVAILDPRMHTKRYGEEVLENLPSGMRTFDEIETAVAFVGIGPKEQVEASLFT
jgi:Rad3-related DNA helicase